MQYGRRQDRRTAQGFALGMLLGALVGAGAALLLAPASGDDTRRLLRRKARRLSARGEAVLEEVADRAERTARDLARRGRRYAASAADTVDHVLHDR